MRRFLFLVLLFAAAGLFAGEAAAGHVQVISHETAESMCKSAGQAGTTCDYCHGNHCHEIDCDEKGKCYNTVVTSRTGNSGHPVVKGGAGTATGNNPPPKGGVTVGHRPPPSAGTQHGPTGGGSTTIERSSGGRH
jgi:hypothetical protein